MDATVTSGALILAGGDAALDLTGMRRLSLWIEAQSIYPVEYPSADTRAARQRLT